MTSNPTYVLAGDIGGTKTDLAVISADRGPRDPIAQAEFHSADYPALDDVVREFRKVHDFPLAAACFDIAGPVVNGRVHTTNLPWVVDETELQGNLDIPVIKVFNDLEATALGIAQLGDSDGEVLATGRFVQHGPIAVIAPGTGLGEAFLTWDGSAYQPHPSEGGHADFAPADEEQIALLRYLAARDGHVSWERACSGLAVPDLYAFLRDDRKIAESPAIALQVAAAPDKTRFILNTAVESPGSSALCTATLRLFASILGAEAGNLALKVMATGGVYLAGHIPMAILPALQDESFTHAFTSKGRMSHLMTLFPMKVVKAQAALIGAAVLALRLVQLTNSHPPLLSSTANGGRTPQSLSLPKGEG
jgi:glucokinase